MFDGQPSQHPILHCSFCGKARHEVRKLIAGPIRYICSSCAERGIRALADASGAFSCDDGSVSPLQRHLCCSFCGNDGRLLKALYGGNGRWICGECLALCSDIIGDGEQSTS